MDIGFTSLCKLAEYFGVGLEEFKWPILEQFCCNIM